VSFQILVETEIETHCALNVVNSYDI